MKRFILLTIILLIISGLTFHQNLNLSKIQKQTAVSAQTTSTDWPQLQRDAQHSGYVPQTVIPPYTMLWKRGRTNPTLPPMPPISVRVQPVVANNLIFLPSNDTSIYALKTADGSTAWSFATEGALVNSAAYDNGRIFFGSTDGYVYALNVTATSGTLAWKYKTNGPIKTAPVVANGKVFIGSTDGCMYALSATTTNTNGQLVWAQPRCIGAPIYDTAAFDNGKIFFGGMDAKGYALKEIDGTDAWPPFQTKGQGFRDRWTVAGNGKVFYTPVLQGKAHDALETGTQIFQSRPAPTPIVYNQSWDVQKAAILNHLSSNPYQQPIYILDQNTGIQSFVAPILFISGGSQSAHSQPILLPNGNANVMYRRSFGEIGEWGATTNSNIYSGELDLTTNPGDIKPVDTCLNGSGGIWNCGTYKGQYTSDESSTHFRSGDILYLDIARGTYGLDTRNQINLKTLACYVNGSGGKFCETGTTVDLSQDGIPQGSCNTGGGWRVNTCDLYSETNSDGNDIKRPSVLVGDTFYIFHLNTLVAVKGTIRP